jgi:hypothetical protein
MEQGQGAGALADLAMVMLPAGKTVGLACLSYVLVAGQGGVTLLGRDTVYGGTQHEGHMGHIRHSAWSLKGHNMGQNTN